MPYTKAHKARTHARIVEETARAIRERGIEDVSIADLMRAANLTHGGFYAHFPDKSALIAEATARGLEESHRAFLADAAAASPADPLREVIRRYVSRQHRDDLAGGCAMPALAGEIAHGPNAVRHAFTGGVEHIVEGLAAHTPGETTEERRDAALALTAGMVGAVALARAVDDPELSDRILLATRRFFTETMASSRRHMPAGEEASGRTS